MFDKTVSRCALRFETLEEKALLAGDVAVAVVNGNVFVTGDADNNHIELHADVANERFVIRGLPDADGIETTVNGQSGPVAIDGLNRNVTIHSGRGADVVDVPRGLFQDLTIATGPGNDVVRLGTAGTDGAPTRVTGSLMAGLGQGNDRLGMEQVSVDGNMLLRSGKGADHIALHKTRAAATVIDTGSGSDRVAVVDSAFERLGISTGQGDDRVGVSRSTAGALRIGLGDGNDLLAIGQTQVLETAIVNGGAGRDRLTGLGGNMAGRVAISAFEVINHNTAELQDSVV